MGMKNRLARTVIVLLLFLGGIAKGASQENDISHTVKEGETLYSIAKQYRVTPYSILQKNPEIKDVESIRPNTIVIIPMTVKEDVAEPKIPSTGLPSEELIQNTEPVGFSTHKVKKRETLFSLCKHYGITEEQLKRYNKGLYSQSLKKGMLLKIPRYPEKKPETVKENEPIDFQVHVVQQQDTRWSIANAYAITLDSLAALNPQIEAGSSYLAIGQELKVPRPIGDSLNEQQVAIFESFTVPKSMGLFRVSQDYGIPVDSIMALNPEIKEVGGLREGMVLRLPKPQPNLATVDSNNFIFYEVKPKQNLFRLTKQLQIGRDSLFYYNPELEQGLKAGMVLKLPKYRSKGLDVKNALILDKINLQDSLNLANAPNILMMLPFRLDRIDFMDIEKTEKQVGTRKDITYAMGLYTGAMIAVDSINAMGISVDLKIIDTQLSLPHLRQELLKTNLNHINAIFGPVGPNLLSEVAVQAKEYDIPVVVPAASKSEVSLSNVFYTYPKTDVLRKNLLDHLEKQRENQSIIIIADEKQRAAKDSIVARFPSARIAKMSEDGSLHLIDFQAMLSEEEENWVFVETEEPNLVASVTSILNASNAEIIDEETGEKKEIVVKMFSTNYNGAFENESISRPHLSNLEFTFPSAFKIETGNQFTKAYKRKYGHQPDRYAVRGFDLMMDLLLKLGYNTNLFETETQIGLTEYGANRFNYIPYYRSGYFNEACYLMQYENLRIKQLDE